MRFGKQKPPNTRIAEPVSVSYRFVLATDVQTCSTFVHVIRMCRFHVHADFRSRKTTRRGSCDQRAVLPGAKLSGIGCTRRLSQKPSPDKRMIQGSIPVSNGNGADRNLHRSMRLHAGTEVLSCGRHIPARLHCTVPDPRVNNAATRSRRGRGTWISSRVSDPTPRHRKVRSPTKVAAGNPPAKW